MYSIVINLQELTGLSQPTHSNQLIVTNQLIAFKP